MQANDASQPVLNMAATAASRASAGSGGTSTKAVAPSRHHPCAAVAQLAHAQAPLQDHKEEEEEEGKEVLEWPLSGWAQGEDFVKTSREGAQEAPQARDSMRGAENSDGGNLGDGRGVEDKARDARCAPPMLSVGARGGEGEEGNSCEKEGNKHGREREAIKVSGRMTELQARESFQDVRRLCVLVLCAASDAAKADLLTRALRKVCHASTPALSRVVVSSPSWRSNSLAVCRSARSSLA